ncbi:MAG TPA: hypothetical protein VH280_14860 [Verrucomicrobiae bacterium]|jgi:hypothetical protein|nr:hypothetical protein [Verrucomicrobiae bacterium]
MGDLFSSLQSDVGSIAQTGTSLLPLASGINGLVNGTPAASPATTAAASASSTSWIMYAVLGGIGLLAVIFFLGKK